jgi:hypothetical protein
VDQDQLAGDEAGGERHDQGRGQGLAGQAGTEHQITLS